MTQTVVPGRVFITGALGFIGQRLSEHYRRAGVEVTGVDVRDEPSLGVVRGDITEAGAWQKSLQGADVVVHAAARLGMGGDAESFWRINCLGTRNVIDAAVRGNVPRFVHLSSVVAFGFDYPDGVDENFPLRPNGVPYVDSKVASEQLVFQAHAAGEIACTILRPGDIYGPGSYYWTVMAVRAIAARRLILPAMGLGQLAPVFVDDLVDGIVLAASRPEAVGHVFTLVGGPSVETREFFGHYARMLGKRGVSVAPTAVVLALAATIGRLRRLRHHGDFSLAGIRYIARKGSYSIEKARQRLGYHPRVDLEEGMRRTEVWLRDQGLVPKPRCDGTGSMAVS